MGHSQIEQLNDFYYFQGLNRFMDKYSAELDLYVEASICTYLLHFISKNYHFVANISYIIDLCEFSGNLPRCDLTCGKIRIWQRKY